ncbi:hypothetical protein H0H81_008036 [Sphagnurus paluster]|uniref:Uncharacterized protein n=1 Tax=Sphagnurus paluster TaxID=117069 RepID=A0A9P7K381_9AGAR|nr:hypothetical protein H0H81_008036 [Sphagnurus paluster]
MFSQITRRLVLRSSTPRHSLPVTTPHTPILLSGPAPAHNHRVHWWTQDTHAIVGVFSSPIKPCTEELPVEQTPVQEAPLPEIVCVLPPPPAPSAHIPTTLPTAPSALSLAIPSIILSDGPSPPGFSLETGISTLGDYSGVLSCSTIADSEDGDEDLASLYSVESDVSGSSESNPSSYSEIADQEMEAAMRAAVRAAAARQALEHAAMMAVRRARAVPEVEVIVPRDASIKFGKGRALRRTPTITAMVGEAILMRRCGATKYAYEHAFRARRNTKYTATKSSEDARWVSFTLTMIEEVVEDGEC